MSNKFEAAKQLGKGVYQLGKTVFKKLKGNKTSPTITAIKPGTKLTRKRKEQDDFVKSRDKILQGTSPATKTEIKTKNPLTTLKSKVKNILTPDELAKGGRVGLKKGSKKKTNVEKIKKAFGSKKSLGMQSIIYGLDKNPNITKADPKAKFIAAAMKKKKKKKVI